LLNLVSESEMFKSNGPARQSRQADHAKYNTNMPPIMLMIFKKLFVNWSSNNKDAKMMGRSVSRGAKVTGKLWCHPPLRVSEMRKDWNGPGVAAAVTPRAAPCRKKTIGEIVSILVSVISLLQQDCFRGKSVECDRARGFNGKLKSIIISSAYCGYKLMNQSAGASEARVRDCLESLSCVVCNAGRARIHSQKV